MEKIVFRFNEGCQSYLYDCYILINGFKPIKFCEDAFFAEVVDLLLFMVNPMNPDSIDDVKLAEHLLQIAKRTDYTFTVSVDDVRTFIGFLKKNKQSQNPKEHFAEEVGDWETLIFS